MHGTMGNQIGVCVLNSKVLNRGSTVTAVNKLLTETMQMLPWKLIVLCLIHGAELGKPLPDHSEYRYVFHCYYNQESLV